MKQFRTLRPDEIECRVAQCNEKGASILLYKTARTDADILDETVGAQNWENDFKLVDGVLYGGIGIETLDKLTGYFVEKDFDTVQMSLMNASGKRDGFTSFDFEEIVYITAQGEREKYMETVMEMLAAESPADGSRGGVSGMSGKAKQKKETEREKTDHSGSKKEESGRVITFPKKDK